MTFDVRPMMASDVPACVDIINPIIEMGGSTAHEEPYDVATLTADYFQKPATAMVVTKNTRVIGFQSCFEVEPGIYSIGSFTDQQNPERGAGRAMFQGTLAAARANGASAILAKITSDNAGGLAYYTKMGFVDFKVVPADLTRADGTVVDRIIKRYSL